MPKIPSYGVPQVQARVTPNVRIDDSGAQQIRQAGASIAGGMQDAAGVAQQIARHEQDKINTALQMRVENDLADLENGLLHDPERGALTRRGADAADVTIKVLPEWDKQASTIVRRLPRHLQQWGSQQATKRRELAERRLMQHMVEQNHAFMLQQGASLEANARDAAALAYRDPDRVDEEIVRGIIAVDRVLDLQGADEITRQRKRAEFTSSTQRQVIERILLDDPMQARRRLGQVRERLTAADQMLLDEQLQVIEQDLQGDLDALWAEEGGAMPPDALAGPSDGRAPPKVPPLIRTTIEAAADRHGVPRALALAMAQQESGFNPAAVGPETQWGRARGLYQYLDDTARSLGIDPANPEQSADAAMRQLAEQAAAKGWEWAIAHHHAGPDKRQHGPKTRSYVAQVKEKARRFNAAGDAATGSRVEVAGPAATLADALERLQAIPDPRRRRVAEAKVREQFEIRQARQKEGERQIEDAIYARVIAADPNAPLRNVLPPQLLAVAARNESLMDDIRRFRKELTSGPVIEDDPATLDAMLRLQATDPQKFATLPLARYGSRLTGKTMKELADDQAKVREGKTDSREYATLGQQLGDAYRKLDWAPTGKTNETERGQFYSAYLSLAREFVDQHKRKPDAVEREKLIASLLVKQARIQNGKRTGEPLALWERLQYVPDIDAGTRQQIVEGWQAVNGRNRQPTEQQIYALYFMEHGAPE
jgi:soluble lytic murein transglycosylase-like protein